VKHENNHASVVQVAHNRPMTAPTILILDPHRELADRAGEVLTAFVQPSR